MMTVMYNALEFDNGGGRARRPSAPRRRLSNRSRSAKSAPAKVAGDDVLDAAVRAALAGDEEGFRTLYRALQPGLLRYLRTVVGDEAEDVASETWAQIARGMDSFSGRADAFRGWATTIARNRAIDHLRRVRRRPMADESAEELLKGRAAADDTAASALSAIGTDDALALISKLPRDQAEAIMLRLVLDLDSKTAARILGKRSGAVRSATHRGLRTLASMLDRPDGASRTAVSRRSVTDPSGGTLKKTT